MRALSLPALALLVCAVPAFANVTVSHPGNGARVVSPFGLDATSTPCSSQPVAAMGYSLDNSSDTTIVPGTYVNAQVTSTTGTHTLHVKSWVCALRASPMCPSPSSPRRRLPCPQTPP
jgi:hypothetical protein